ncbi:hypothetical protein ONZ45_g2429 [Pleurotus djamor]|nr:hypothetical protein ONZ45_g2429 [Pleurotus djamor]
MAEIVGTLAAQHSVDPNGSLSIDVALTLPPAKMAPNLSISYHSAANNASAIGMGWTIKGASYIERVPATMAQDKIRGSVNYDSNDRFALDGQRLMSVGNNEYRYELETWSKIVAHGNSTNPDYWVEYLPDGTQRTFGNTSDSKIKAAGGSGTRAWAVSENVDPFKNYVTYKYFNDANSGAFYLSQVQYGGNKSLSMAHQRQVDFAYVQRPDVRTRYIGGYKVCTDKRLSTITSHVQGKLAHTHTLHYDDAPLSNVSRLTSITLSDASGAKVRPLTFDWNNGDVSVFGAARSPKKIKTDSKASVMALDVNASGKSDLVLATKRFVSNQYKLRLDVYRPDDNGDISTTPSSTFEGLNYPTQLLPLDFNGDGRTDFLHVSTSTTLHTLTLIMSTPNGYVAKDPVEFRPSYIGGSFHVGDFEGNGHVGLCYIYQGLKSGTPQIKYIQFTSDGNKFKALPECEGPYGVGVKDIKVITGDLNGDNAEDIFILYSAFKNGSKRVQIELLQSDANGRLKYRSDKPLISVAESIVWTTNINFFPYAADEDGKTSILAVSKATGGTLQLQMIRSSGPTLLPPSPAITTSIAYNGNVSLAKTSSTTAVDLVNTFDNKVASPSHTELTVLRFTNDTFSILNSVRQPTSSSSFVTWADLRGLGRVDCLLNTLDYQGNLTVTNMPCASAAPPDYIKSYANGLGARLDVDYAPLSDRTTYSADGADGSESPLAAVNALARNVSFMVNLSSSTLSQSSTHARSQIVYFPSFVVKKLKYTPCAAHASIIDESDYTYENARYAYDGRGWRGFEKVTKTAVVIGSSTTTEYHQEFPLLGQSKLVTVSNLHNGQTLQTTENTWGSTQGNSGANQFVCLSKVRERHYESGAFAHEADVDYDHDAYGNITSITTTTPQTGTHPLRILATFANDPSAWVIGQKLSETVKQASSTLKQTSWTYVPNSLTAKQESRMVSSSTWSTVAYEFDASGNEITITGPGNALRKFTYDQTYTNVTSSSVYTAKGAEPLVETAEYDLITGKPTMTTSPSGDIMTLKYDILGRMIETSVGNQVVQKQAYETNGTDFYSVEYTDSGDDDGDVWFKTVNHIDGLERIWRTEVPRPDDPDTMIYSDIEYDGAGRVTKKARSYLQGTSPSFALFSYDSLSRLTRQTLPPASSDVSSVTTTYDYSFSNGAMHAKETCTDGHTTVVTSRDVQHLPNPQPTATKLTKPFVINSINELGQSVSTQYDGLGQPLQITDPSGTCLKLSWDGIARVTKRTVTNTDGSSAADIHRALAVYDDAKGTVTITNDLTGTTSVTQLDWAGRPVKKVNPDETLTMIYDIGGDFTKEQLVSVTSSNGTKHGFDYDRRGNITSAKVSIDSVDYVTSYKWSLSGELLHVTNPDGSSLTRELYGDGETIKRVELLDAQSSVRAWANFQDYSDPFNRPLGCEFGNGVSSSSKIASNGSLSELSLSKGGAVIHHQTWKIDAFSRIQQYGATTGALGTSSTNVSTNVFSYDSAGQLTQCAPDGAHGSDAAEHYLYDHSGNLQTKNGKKFINKGWQLHEVQDSTTGTTEYTFKYSSDGRLVSKVDATGQETASMEYDCEGRLSKLNDTRFVYDFAGRLLKATFGDGSSRIYPSQTFEVDISSSGDKTYTAYLTQGYRRASLTTGPSTSVVRYFHTDHLGSTVAVSDDKGEIVSEYQYDSFGKLKLTSGEDLSRYKFSGKEIFDGLYYFGARFYDPDTGRFLTLDSYPIDVQGATPATFNMYSFSRNDPINYLDMNGNVPWWHWLVDVALIAVGVALMFVPGVNGVVAGILMGVVTGAIMGAGMAGLSYDIKAQATGESNDKDWGIAMGLGALFGGISGGISAGIDALLPAVTIIDVSTNMGAIGSGMGVLRQMTENGIEGKRWDDNLGSAAAEGAISGFESALKGAAQKFLKPLKGKGFRLKFWKNRNWKVYNLDGSSTRGLSQATSKNLDYPLNNGGPRLTGYKPLGEFSSSSSSFMQQSSRFLSADRVVGL